MNSVERLKEKWLEAKEAYWQLIRERIVLNSITMNKKHPSGNLFRNEAFNEENKRFKKREQQLYNRAEKFRKAVLGLKNESNVDCYDGYLVCGKCRGMFQYKYNEKERHTHTFNKCSEHNERTESFSAYDLEELWTR